MRTLIALFAEAKGFSHRAVFQAFAERLSQFIVRRRGAEVRVRVVDE